MERLTKDNWLSGHENEAAFWLMSGVDGKMIYDFDRIDTFDVDWNGYVTLEEAKKQAEWVLDANPDYPFSIVATALVNEDQEVIDEYLEEYGNDLIIIEEYNQ